jgi:hypothetical protein
VKEGSKWRLTTATLTEAFWQRADRLTALRRAEQQQMQEYVVLGAGHMEFLVGALDGELSEQQSPDVAPLPEAFDEGIAREALTYLRRTSLPLDPRRQWPGGGLQHTNVSGNIAEAFRAQPGRILCIWNDAGWGSLVRQGKSRDGHFADQLVEACAAMVRSWAPQPAPAWVTCIPSRRHPNLVPDFARRLAVALNRAHLDTAPASNGAATSSLPSHALSQGDEDVATPFLFSHGGSVGMRPQVGRDELLLVSSGVVDILLRMNISDRFGVRAGGVMGGLFAASMVASATPVSLSNPSFELPATGFVDCWKEEGG